MAPQGPERDASAGVVEQPEAGSTGSVESLDATSEQGTSPEAGNSSADSGGGIMLAEAGLPQVNDAGADPNQNVTDAASVVCPEMPELSSTDTASKFASFLFYNMRVYMPFHGIIDWSMYTSAQFGVSINPVSGTSAPTSECVETTIGSCTRTECSDAGGAITPAPSGDTKYIELPVTDVTMTGLAVDPLPMPLDTTWSSLMYTGRTGGTLWTGGETARILVQGACGVPDFDLEFEVPNRAEFTSPGLVLSGTTNFTTGSDLRTAWEPGVGEVSIGLSQLQGNASVQCTVDASEGEVVVDAALFEDFSGEGFLSITTTGALTGTQDDWRYSIQAMSHYAASVQWLAP